MRLARPIAIGIVSLGLCLGHARAQDSDARVLAEKLLGLMGVEKAMDELREQMGQVLSSQMDGLEIPEAQREKAAAFQQRVVDLVFEELSFARMKPEYVELYATTFSADELRAIVGFYESPGGRAFAEKMPALMQRSVEMTQRLMQALMPRIQTMTEAFMADVQQSEGGAPSSD
jgi:hypothetical protein